MYGRYALGFYVGRHTFAGSAAFARTVKAYYLIFFMIALFISMPTLHGRCDRYPPETIWERFRWYVVECFLTLLLLTRSLDASDPNDVLTALGWWALWAFCAHVMFARTLPMPWGVVVSYGTVIPFLLAFKLILPAIGWVKKKPPRDPAADSSVEPMLAPPPPVPTPEEAPPPPYGTFGFGGIFGRRAR